MSKIFITGDTHYDIDINKLRLKSFQDKTGVDPRTLTKDDYVIVCGDFGILWFLNTERTVSGDKMIKWYNSLPWTTLFIDGNHENFDALNALPVEKWHGGNVHKISDSIIHLMRGQVFDIDGKTFFTMGGATSVDKFARMPHVSWWPQELPSHEEYETALNTLEAHNYSVDYVLTHCCAATYQRELIHGNDMVTDDLNEFLRHIEFDLKLRFKKWFFGHYHTDRQIDPKHICLYNDIITL